MMLSESSLIRIIVFVSPSTALWNFLLVNPSLVALYNNLKLLKSLLSHFNINFNDEGFVIISESIDSGLASGSVKILPLSPELFPPLMLLIFFSSSLILFWRSSISAVYVLLFISKFDISRPALLFSSVN